MRSLDAIDVRWNVPWVICKIRVYSKGSEVSQKVSNYKFFCTNSGPQQSFSSVTKKVSNYKIFCKNMSL